MSPLASLVRNAGLPPSTPVTIARCDAFGVVEAAVAGAWSSGRPVVESDRFYVASLAKQVTGAAVAILVRDGKLDPDRSVAFYLSELPAWAAEISTRHLLHHVAGLPVAGSFEAPASGDWTTEFALSSLRALPRLSSTPGTVYAYSNLGYILLAQLVERISGLPMSVFVASQLLSPLNIDGMGFAADITAFPQSEHMGTGRPLTHGDGGLWSTSRGFVAWLHQQNQDALDTAETVTTSWRLKDGAEVAYGWGLGLRMHHGHKLLIHGGGWNGAVAKAVRCPALGIAVVAMAANCSFEALDRLVTTALNDTEG